MPTTLSTDGRGGGFSRISIGGRGSRSSRADTEGETVTRFVKISPSTTMPARIFRHTIIYIGEKARKYSKFQSLYLGEEFGIFTSPTAKKREIGRNFFNSHGSYRGGRGCIRGFPIVAWSLGNLAKYDVIDGKGVYSGI